MVGFRSLFLSSLSVVCTSVTLAVAQPNPPVPWGRLTTTANRAADGTHGNGGSHVQARQAVSRDGRFVVFASMATNLVAGDTNGKQDIFVTDRLTGAVSRVSVASDGSEANDLSWPGAISADGRHVAFLSMATNLVPGDTNGKTDVFVHDRVTQATVVVSVTTAGALANGDSADPAISADGRFVAFTSSAQNMATHGYAAQVFVHDRDADADGVFDEPGTVATTWITPGSGPFQSYASYRPSISADGRFVAFDSSGPDLVAGDTNDAHDAFVHDRETGVTTRVSVNTGGAQGPSARASYFAAISADGRFVSFDSEARLTADDVNDAVDIYIHDRTTGETTRVSRPLDPNAPFGSVLSSLSDDGRYVLFHSAIANFVPQDQWPFGASPSSWRVFVFDRASSATRLVSVISAGTATPSDAFDGSISGDGFTVVFETDANGKEADGPPNVGTNTYVGVPFVAAPMTIDVPAAGGTGTIAVGTTPATKWLVTPQPSAAGWLAFSPASAAGATTVSWQAQAQPAGSPAREGTVLIGHTPVLLRQAASPITGQLLATTRLTVNKDPSREGEQVILTAIVAPRPPSATAPTGTVAFYKGETWLGSVTLTTVLSGSTAKAQWWVTGPLPVGVHAFTARFSGDTTYKPSEVSISHTVIAADAQPEPAKKWKGWTSTMQRKSDWTIAHGYRSAFWKRQPMSRDGRFVTFLTTAPLVANDTNSAPDVYVRDRMTGEVLRASVSSSGAQSTGYAWDVTISANGRYVAFTADAKNLVTGDTDSMRDVFIHDRVTRTTVRLNRTPGGANANGGADMPALSADGRFVTYVSSATNMVPTATPFQIVLHDRDADEDGVFDEADGIAVTVVSAPGFNAQSDSICYRPTISADGRYVAYESEATDLVPGDTNGAPDIFVYDRLTGDTTRINTPSDIIGFTQAPAGTNAWNAAISADGRFVAFETTAALVSDDTNTLRDIYVKDRATGQTTRVSVATGGGQLPIGDNITPSISDDGRYVTFRSAVGNYVPSTMAPPTLPVLVVHDRALTTTTIVSTTSAPSGAWVVAVNGWISGDGTSVAFESDSTGIENVYDYQVYVTVPFAIAPTENIPIAPTGGPGTFSVTTTPVTGWRAATQYASEATWISVPAQTQVGSTSLTFTVMQIASNAYARYGTIMVAGSRVYVRQYGFPYIRKFTPISGPAAGGTTVTLEGWGFHPPARVTFDGVDALSVEASPWDDQHITVVTPPGLGGTPAVVRVTIDGLSYTAYDKFTYVDSTPPVVVGSASGPLSANGEWFTGDASVTWSVSDAESLITNRTGCEAIVVTEDTAGRTFTCTATSAGGTSTSSLTVKRDATPPTARVQVPTGIYEPNDVATVDYACEDALSGIDPAGTGAGTGCAGPVASGAALAMSEPAGLYSFHVVAKDRARLQTTVVAPYAIATGVCVPGPSMPVAFWWTGDDTTREIVSGIEPPAWTPPPPAPALPPVAYTADGRVGASFLFGDVDGVGGIDGGPVVVTSPAAAGELAADRSLALWIAPSSAGAANNQPQVFVSRASGYALALFPDRSLRYRFAPAAAWVTTSVRVPVDRWTHLAVVLTDGGGASGTSPDTTVAVYRDGLLADTQTIAGGVENGGGPFVIGGFADASEFAGASPFAGRLDELQVFSAALDAEAVQTIALAGGQGLCRPAASTLIVPGVTALVGGDVTLRATLARAVGGAMLEGRTLTFALRGTPVGQAVTSADGVAEIVVSLSGGVIPGGIAAGTYEDGIAVTYVGGIDAAPAQASASLVVEKRTPAIAWSAASIVYGTPLGAAQLSATSEAPGAFAYTPAAGTVLPAGTHTLSVTFTPTDGDTYVGATATATLQVAPAPLTIRTVDAVKVFGAPLPVFTASAVGFVNGDSFAALDGALVFGTAATATSAVGTYPVAPSGVASQNYAIAFAPGTLTIDKAATSTTLSASSSPSGLNEPVTFTARVQPVAQPVATGAGAPTGTVGFFNGATLLGRATLASGEARLTTGGLGAGTRAISAQYDGDASFVASTGALSHVVSTSQQSTTTTLSVSPNPASVGQNVTLTANVSRPAGAVTGTVRFFDGATVLGESTITSGSAKLTTNTLPPGVHLLRALYVGATNVPASQSPIVALTVGSSGSRTPSFTWSISPSSPGPFGATTTFTLNIARQLTRVPSGWVQFVIDGLPPDPAHRVTVQVNGSGPSTAALALSTLPRGTHKITAVYDGDTNFKAGTSVTTYVVQ